MLLLALTVPSVGILVWLVAPFAAMSEAGKHNAKVPFDAAGY